MAQPAGSADGGAPTAAALEPGPHASVGGPAARVFKGSDGMTRLLYGLAIAFAFFQIVTAAYSPISSLITRALHVSFLMAMVFLTAAALRPEGPRRGLWNAIDVFLAVIGFLPGAYQWIFEGDLNFRAGDPSDWDIAVAVLAVVLVFEGARRIMGPALPLICAAFLAYAMFGQYLPPPLDHRGYAFGQVADQIGLSGEGIYGIPTLVSATYIFLFITFGAFLERAGIIQLFSDLAVGTVGHTTGGPAKVAVVASAMMGTVNGSGVANVVSTGQFTIPLMKRSGFKPHFAGAVEATASMGGQIMPPVMGAVAFIMAETLGISYAEVVQAAIVPALLYFFAAFWMVHLEALRLGLKGLDRAELPSVLAALKRGWYLIGPLAALVWLLFAGYTPLFAGTVGLAFTAVLILGIPLAARLGPMHFRVVFWLAIGCVGALFFEYGVDVLTWLMIGMVAAVALIKGGRATIHLCGDALAEGARNAVSVGVACALVGVIIGTMTLTGAATNFAAFITDIGEGNLFLSLVLTMLTCLILGMGIPTIPNYIITSSLVGPALLDLGVPLIVSHMFVFYFGIMADLTPPVALAAYAAAPIAQAPGMKIGLTCMRIAIAGFVTPFMAVYAPILMLQPGGPYEAAMGYIPAAFYMISKAVLAIGLWGAATIGILGGRLSWAERIWATAAAILLVASIPWTDEAGWAMGLAFIAWRWWRRRGSMAAQPA